MSRFRNLTPAQERAFERIAVNAPPQCSAKTLAALEGLGLIAKDVHFLDDGGWPPVTVQAYYVPLRVHHEWCSWCSEQLTGWADEEAVVG